MDSYNTRVYIRSPKRQETAHIMSASTTAPHEDVEIQLEAGTDEKSNTASSHLREDISHDYVMDEHGDLILRLIYDGTTTDVKVCSRTLARSCKFFSTLLYGPFKESNSGLRAQGWVVVMEELEPETVVRILRFVHLHDTREMKGLTGMQIRDVVHMLDYLGCEKLFRDVMGAWEATIRKEASKSMKMAGNGLLYAALYLGLKECFVKMMNKLQNQANNRDCCVPPSKSTSATALRDKNMPLRFRNNKPMEFDPMLQQFGLAGLLKARRDFLWAIEQDNKRKGLELYDKLFGKYLPNKDAGKNPRTNRVKEIAQGPVPPPNAPVDASVQYHLCAQLQRKRMPSENFQWANHQAGSLLSCFEKLRGLDPFPRPPNNQKSPQVQRVESGLRRLGLAYYRQVIKYDKFDLPKWLEDFLESRKKCFGA